MQKVKTIDCRTTGIQGHDNGRTSLSSLVEMESKRHIGGLDEVITEVISERRKSLNKYQWF